MATRTPHKPAAKTTTKAPSTKKAAPAAAAKARARKKAAAPVVVPPEPAAAVVRASTPVPAPEPGPKGGPEASPLARWVYEQRVAEAKYAVSRPIERLREQENLGDLPGSYAANLLTLLPLNPRRAYAYWDLDYRRLGEHYQGLSDGRPVVRLFRAVEGQFQPESELDVDLGAHNHYFPVVAGGVYTAEIGLRGANGYRRILTSNVLTVPVDRVADETEATFVAVPLDTPLPLHTARKPAPGFGPGGRALSRAEYERLYGKGVPGLTGSPRR